jgi:hypothetical protein
MIGANIMELDDEEDEIIPEFNFEDLKILSIDDVD